MKTSGRHAEHGRKKGGIKKNTVLHGLSLMLHFIEFSAAANHDQQIFKALKLPEGSCVIFDKGYNNYKHFAAFSEAEIFFITRQKENAVYTSLLECTHDESSPDNILNHD